MEFLTIQKFTPHHRLSMFKIIVGLLLLLVVSISVIAAWVAFGLNGNSYFVFSAQAADGINKQLNYQGKIADSNGVALSSGSYNFHFAIFSAASGGTALWEEAWTATSTAGAVTVAHGVFSVALGTSTAMSLDFNQDALYLEVQMDADGNGSFEETFAPRKRLTSAPYAFTADMVDGLHATSTATANQLLALDASAGMSLNSVTTTGTLYVGGYASSTTGLYTQGNIYSGGSATTSDRFYAGTQLSVATSTPTPGYALTVLGNSYLSGNLYNQGSATTTGTLYVGGYASTTGGLFTQGNIITGGRIGVNKANPTAQIDIATSDIPVLRGYSTYGGGALYIESTVIAVEGYNTGAGGSGIYGFNTNTNGGRAVYGETAGVVGGGGYAGYFVGDTYIDGNATTTRRLMVGSFTGLTNLGYATGDLSVSNNAYISGFASTTGGLFTQGDGHIGGNFTIDGNATTTGRTVLGSTNPTNDFGKLWVGGDTYLAGEATSTGNFTVSQSTPEFKLRTTGDSNYARLLRSDTNGRVDMYNMAYRPGGVGSGISCPTALSDYVTFPAFDLPGSYTVAIWTYIKSVGEYKRIISKSGDNYDFYMQSKASNNIEFGHRDSDGGVVFYNSPVFSITAPAWHRIVFVYAQNDKFYFYFDGDLIGSGTTGGDISLPMRSSSDPWNLGTFLGEGYGDYYNWDDLQIYSTTKDQTWVTADYNSENGTYQTETANLELGVHMDEGSGTSMADYSGNGRNATFNGTPEWVTGKVSTSAGDTEILVWSSQDGSDENEKGIQTFGDDNGRAILQGQTIRFETAATERMRIVNGGAVGIGTTTPAYKLVVNSDNATDNLLQVATTTNQNIFVIDHTGHVSVGGTPNAGIELDVRQDNGNRGTISVGTHVADFIGAYVDSGTIFAGMTVNLINNSTYARDGTAGSLLFSDGNWYFRTYASGSANDEISVSSNRIIILNSGNVGIGDSTPAELFTVGNGDKFTINADGSATTTSYISIGTAPTGANFTTGSLNVQNNVIIGGYASSTLGYSTQGGIHVGGTIGNDNLNVNGPVYSNNGILTNVNPSSQEYKDSIQAINLDPMRLLQLQPKSFVWKNNSQADFGYIAEEVKEVMPELYQENNGVTGWQIGKLPFYIIEILKMQQQQIDSLIATSTPETSQSLVNNFDALAVQQAATFYGTITVYGEAGFEAKVVFKKDVEVQGKLYVASDQAGTVKILANATSTHVVFGEEYRVAPKVVVTPQNQLNGNEYWISDKATTGFRINLSPTLAMDLEFDWVAMPVLEEGEVAGAQETVVSGCTDAAALNYNNLATQNDNTCFYAVQVPTAEPAPAPITEPAPAAEPAPVAEIPSAPVEPIVPSESVLAIEPAIEPEPEIPAESPAPSEPAPASEPASEPAPTPAT